MRHETQLKKAAASDFQIVDKSKCHFCFIFSLWHYMAMLQVRGFFCSFSLLYPRASPARGAFFAVFCFYVPSASKMQSIYGSILSSHAEKPAN